MCACVCMCVCVSRGGGDKVGRKGEDGERWSWRDNRGIVVQQNEGMIGEEE